MKPVRLLTVLLLSLELSGCLIAPLQPKERQLFEEVFYEGGADLSDDQEICPIHGVPRVSQQVPVYDGMMVEIPRYVKARVRRFPYSFIVLYSGGCEDMGERHQWRQVCPRCREEEEKWHKRHSRRSADR